MKPVAVAVGLPNVGFNAANSEASVTSCEPTRYPVLVVVIVAVEPVSAATPVTVTKPLSLTATKPGEATAVQLYLVL